MNKTIKIIAGSLALSLVACENTETAMMNPEAETVILAYVGDADVASRTAIDPTTYTGGHVGILWTSDDALGVFGGTVGNARFACTASAPTGRAAFKGNCAAPRYAYYPYSAVNDGAEPTAISGTLPAMQEFDSASGRIEGDYKYGMPREDAEGEFDFSHFFALFRFNLEATGTPLAGERLRSVTLELPEQRCLAGDFTADITTGAYSFTGNTANAVTMQWADTPVLTNGNVYTAYMSVAPDLRADDPVAVTVVTDRHTAKFTATIAYDFAPNTVYTFNFRLRLFADIVVEDIPVEPEEETANCYMITAAGEHDFKATVIGNGQKGIIPGAGFHTEDATIAPRSAKLLWEDVDGFVTDVELRDGRVHYTATGNSGNAVIAVYSGSDATGDILWSWHIWGVGDTLPGDVELTNYNGHKYTVMSRNLGDRADKRAYGVHYQWGRKDPVPSDSIIYVDGAAVTVDVLDGSTRKYRYLNRIAASESASATISLGVRNPMQLITMESGNDWLAEENLYLWGNTYFADAQAADEEAFSDVKTIYDPSPVGYRVANCRTFSFFCKNESGQNQSSVASVRLDRINYVNFDKGFYFKANEADTEGVWFPYTGYRDGYFVPVTVYSGNGNKRIYFTSVGRKAGYWYSNPAAASSGAGRSMYMNLWEYRENPASNTSYNTINVYNFFKRSSALAVRCVREK